VSDRAVVVLLVLTSVGTTLFWVTFFGAGGVLHSSETDVYLAYERAFPVADGWMAACAALAAVGVVRRRGWAVLCGIAAGSALVFLGLLDVTFDLEGGLYAPGRAAVLVEQVINVYCLTVGPFLIVWFWRQRRRLDPSSPR
jgi:hypothetical protein